MADTKKTKKQDFIEIEFTGYHDGKVFDSNIPEDLKELNPEAEPEKTVVIIGENMVVPGLDKALEDKEINKEYEIHLPYKEGFGPRKRELVRTIPLKVFTAQKINPHPGAALFLDNMLARVITVSGARVVTDFNNPLSGKDIDYKFKIVRIVNDEKEKCEAFFRFFFRMDAVFEIQDKKVIVKGPEPVKHLVDFNGKKFREIFGKELEFKKETISKKTTGDGQIASNKQASTEKEDNIQSDNKPKTPQ